jgi:hypothetical protein
MFEFFVGYFTMHSASRPDIFNHFQFTAQRTRRYDGQGKDFTIKITRNAFVFKSSLAKIHILVLFIKIMLIVDFDDFSPASFPRSCKLADPSHHTSAPGHGPRRTWFRLLAYSGSFITCTRLQV